ncbi:sugar O-acetyltransferase [Streptobacillus ratti]|uniref:sugar O-acetyltransferase n=1 Tax=Streptobacillus ratti TaxID=1720557 RepID=UPI000934860F|nr:sugar O-acetyltransferase [Streptobacillus ratti]
MTEREKLEHGFWYDANYDKELLDKRIEAESLCFSLNQTNPKEIEKREDIMKNLLPNKGKDITILSPFYTDYGYNCVIGDFTFINHNAYLMDCATIKIGTHCFIGPNCGMYTAIHPLLANERNKGLEKAKPITIGDNVWIGADVTILPGVTIGSNSVIGAKSIVTKDIPDSVIAIGNPCKVLRKITEQDSIVNELLSEENKIK